ncbi:hypothetical protein RP20_CCG010936 [Aedes albopictus]|nr:hypothetical protein RP20_CCG010936 [Aedes albopictus]
MCQGSIPCHYCNHKGSSVKVNYNPPTGHLKNLAVPYGRCLKIYLFHLRLGKSLDLSEPQSVR